MAKNTFATESARNELTVRQERALLVGVLLEGGPLVEDPLAELAELARTAGAEVVDRVIQRRRSYLAATCVGKGKLEEIRQRADANEIDVVIFNNDLSPSQIREIEEVVKRKVVDRSELILDIFASRARTAEARLQVELAQLEYTAPRLRGMWTHLERIAGAGGGTGVGSVGGIGTRGPGERQIEIDRRIVKQRISHLKERIREIDQRRVREVRARRHHVTVSLVGYTNAGKSTLMNALTGAGTLAEDKLFATLDTLTRRWSLGAGRYVLLSDTVGFIRDLPHRLVASFRATLEEAIHADLLLHVADASSPEAVQQVEAVEQVLAEIGAEQRPVLLILNKMDVPGVESVAPILQQRYPGALRISARTGSGLDPLARAVEQKIAAGAREVVLSLPAANGRALAYLEQAAEVLERQYEGDRACWTLRATQAVLNQLAALEPDLEYDGNSEGRIAKSE